MGIYGAVTERKTARSILVRRHILHIVLPQIFNTLFTYFPCGSSLSVVHCASAQVTEDGENPSRTRRCNRKTMDRTLTAQQPGSPHHMSHRKPEDDLMLPYHPSRGQDDHTHRLSHVLLPGMHAAAPAYDFSRLVPGSRMSGHHPPFKRDIHHGDKHHQAFRKKGTLPRL